MFVWKIFPGHTTLQLLLKIQRTMEEKHILLEQFEDQIIRTERDAGNKSYSRPLPSVEKSLRCNGDGNSH